MRGLSMTASRGALVIKEMKIDEDSDRPIHIVARKAGLIAWFLALIGVDPTIEFDVYKDRVEFFEGSLSGKMRHMIPLKAICNLGSGYFKPIIYVVMAILCLVIGITLGCIDISPFFLMCPA